MIGDTIIASWYKYGRMNAHLAVYVATVTCLVIFHVIEGDRSIIIKQQVDGCCFISTVAIERRLSE